MDEARRRTRRAFLTMGGAAAAGYAGWQWLWSGPADAELPARVRGVLDFNGRLAERALYRQHHLAPEFPRSAVTRLRVNGDAGMAAPPPANLAVTRFGEARPRSIGFDQVRNLPKFEQITEFKCIEGWSSICYWGGARFSDFLEAYARESRFAPYVALATADNEYFVGVDMASMLHPQTILAYEKDGRPLAVEHGAPLRLVIPVKYGIKNIKAIASISFATTRPRDYWAEDGYDYYAGL